MHITTIGLDLAKNIFQVHGVTEDGSVAFNRPLRRTQMLPFFAKLEPCLIGIEACGTSHYWGRELRALGHDVKLMPPAYVKPYVKRGKSDAADAEAICEAVTRPTMRFVAIKSANQQAILCQHRAREIMVGQRTQLSNTGAELLFELISLRYECGSTLITSNLPFEEWTDTFGTERLTGALLDRLTHHVSILEMNGDSYRLAQSKARLATA